MIVIRIKRDLQFKRGDLLGISNGSIYRLERVSHNLNTEVAEDETLQEVSAGYSAEDPPEYASPSATPEYVSAAATLPPKKPFKRNMSTTSKVYHWADGEQEELASLVKIVVSENQGRPTKFAEIAKSLGIHHVKNRREHNMLTHVVRTMFHRGELIDHPVGGGEYKTIHAYTLASKK